MPPAAFISSTRREAGGVEAALGLLAAARRQQPASRELPWDEDAAEAAGTALHALLVLLTGGRCCRLGAQAPCTRHSSLASHHHSPRLLPRTPLAPAPCRQPAQPHAVAARRRRV